MVNILRSSIRLLRLAEKQGSLAPGDIEHCRSTYNCCPGHYLLSTNSTCIAAYANTINTPEKMANPTASFQKANTSNPKVLRIVAPGTSMSNPNL